MMNVGGGEAADQLVRMMLTGSEAAIRLSGSAARNMLALTMALRYNVATNRHWGCIDGAAGFL